MIRCQALPSILSLFLNRFDKFKNAGAQMQNSVYHMTNIGLRSAILAQKRQDFAIKVKKYKKRHS